MGTLGFCAPDDDKTAVCVMPGTEIAFNAPIKTRGPNPLADLLWPKKLRAHVAIFRQVNKERAHTHHDALELPDGCTVLLTDLLADQTATVLQLPAAPKTAEEAKDQERLAVVG